MLSSSSSGNEVQHIRNKSTKQIVTICNRGVIILIKRSEQATVKGGKGEHNGSVAELVSERVVVHRDLVTADRSTVNSRSLFLFPCNNRARAPAGTPLARYACTVFVLYSDQRLARTPTATTPRPAATVLFIAL